MVLMFSGFVLLTVSTLASFVGRRLEVSVLRLLSAGSYLLTYPERYVKPQWAKPIRTLTVLGLALILCAQSWPFFA